MPGILVSIFSIVFGCGIALLAIWTEYERDRALIEKGLYQLKKPMSLNPPGWGFLIVDFIIAGVGIALIVINVVFQIGKATGIPGFVFLFISIALLLVSSFARKKGTIPKS